MSDMPAHLNQVYSIQTPWAIRTANGEWDAASHDSPSLIFPGSFNPLHTGHIKLAEVVSQQWRGEVCFEIAVRNADKPEIEPRDLMKRLEQFHARSILITNLPTFVEKSRHFPNCRFVVGIDTAIRILDVRFYENSESRLSEAIREIEGNDCCFIVAPRSIDGSFQTLSDLNVSSQFCHLFEEIPPESFRVDLSSTELRRSDSR